MDLSQLPYGDFLKLGLGGTFLGCGLYLGLQLFRRFGNIEGDYKGLLENYKKDYMVEREKRIAAEAESKVLKKEIAALRKEPKK